MRDELTFSDSDNEHIPDFPILFITNQNNKQTSETTQQNKTENRIQTKHILKSNEVRVEFTSNADDNEDTPVSPILLLVECEAGINWESVIDYLINARFNRVRDELTFNADDKTHTSESPM